jgi:hypothetical protein
MAIAMTVNTVSTLTVMTSNVMLAIALSHVGMEVQLALVQLHVQMSLYVFLVT